MMQNVSRLEFKFFSTGCNVFSVCGHLYQFLQNLFDGVQLDVAICVPVHDVEAVHGKRSSCF